MKTKQKPTTYWDYIRVEQLLDLQTGLEGQEELLSQDEVLFISVHQVYEIWLKLALRDLERARDLFAMEHVPDDAMADACRLLGRLRTIFELATEHFRLIETMTPRDYMNFRDKLYPANGGQSVQFREVEVLIGLEDDARLPYLEEASYLDVLREPDGSEGWAMKRIKARLADRPTVKAAVGKWLYRTPINGSSPGDSGDQEVVAAFIDSYLAAHGNTLREVTERVCEMADSGRDRARLRGRYDAEISEAARFLRAEEVEDEAERARRSRIRAGALFIETYRELPLLAWPREILDAIVALEQAFVTFRQRHARMAERIIGRRIGTGGSTGVDYLDEGALRYRVFGDLWAVRTLLVRRDRSPDPLRSELYRFQFETA